MSMARSEIGIAKCPKSSSGHFTIHTRTIVVALLFACGFLAVQRFTIAPLNAYFCLLPFVLFLRSAFKQNSSDSVAYLIIALICSIDNGGEVYTETPSELRYVIYLSALYIMLTQSKIIVNRKSLIIGIILTSGILFGTFACIGNDISAFDFNAFRRDIQILIVLMFFLFRTKLKHIDLSLIYACCLGYLLGETLNALIFYEPKYGYMSFDSLKVIVFFPFIFSLITQKRLIFQFLLLTATLIVIFMYGSRMLIISAALLFLTSIIVSLIKSNSRTSYTVIAIIIASIMIFDTQSLLNSDFIAPYRALYALIFTLDTITSSQASDLFLLAEQLDPVRFGEHSLFFGRSWIEILLGSG